jgi:hypothetical protein
MRGTTTRQVTMLSTVTSDSLIPMDHPIRRIKPVVETVPAELGPEFDAMYARTGRQSVPPEQLLKATVLMALYSGSRLRSMSCAGGRIPCRRYWVESTSAGCLLPDAGFAPPQPRAKQNRIGRRCR